MDDLKLFAKTKEEIKSLLNTVSFFSSDIGMSFGVTKCAYVGIQRDSLHATVGITLPPGDLIGSQSFGEIYKYLGVFESFDINHEYIERK